MPGRQNHQLIELHPPVGHDQVLDIASLGSIESPVPPRVQQQIRVDVMLLSAGRHGVQLLRQRRTAQGVVMGLVRTREHHAVDIGRVFFAEAVVDGASAVVRDRLQLQAGIDRAHDSLDLPHVLSREGVPVVPVHEIFDGE